MYIILNSSNGNTLSNTKEKNSRATQFFINPIPRQSKRLPTRFFSPMSSVLENWRDSSSPSFFLWLFWDGLLFLGSLIMLEPQWYNFTRWWNTWGCSKYDFVLHIWVGYSCVLCGVFVVWQTVCRRETRHWCTTKVTFYLLQNRCWMWKTHHNQHL